ncbi:MAG: phycobiliprotein lyase [Prochlorococcaceae cyanobacterium]
MSDSQPAAVADFPPTCIKTFLRCCDGEWMSLRSQFSLGMASDDDSWHSSERGELQVHYFEGQDSSAPGGLRVSPKRDGEVQSPRSLHFAADGSFASQADVSSTEAQGRWTLWPDGSLELVSQVGDTELHEKIWFTKPNLRLRSTVEHRTDGSPARASFSSEIRRVSRPA